MAANTLVIPAQDENGNPLASGRVTFKKSGTSTDQAAYSDASFATPLANPYTIPGSAGYLVAYLKPDLAYDVAVKSSDDATTYASFTVDTAGAAEDADEVDAEDYGVSPSNDGATNALALIAAYEAAVAGGFKVINCRGLGNITLTAPASTRVAEDEGSAVWMQSGSDICWDCLGTTFLPASNKVELFTISGTAKNITFVDLTVDNSANTPLHNEVQTSTGTKDPNGGIAANGGMANAGVGVWSADPETITFKGLKVVGFYGGIQWRAGDESDPIGTLIIDGQVEFSNCVQGIICPFVKEIIIPATPKSYRHETGITKTDGAASNPIASIADSSGTARVTLDAGHDLSDGDTVVAESVGGAVELNWQTRPTGIASGVAKIQSRVLRVQFVSTNVFDLYEQDNETAISFSDLTTYTSGGTLNKIDVDPGHGIYKSNDGTDSYPDFVHIAGWIDEESHSSCVKIRGANQVHVGPVISRNCGKSVELLSIQSATLGRVNGKMFEAHEIFQSLVDVRHCETFSLDGGLLDIRGCEEFALNIEDGSSATVADAWPPNERGYVGPFHMVYDNAGGGDRPVAKIQNQNDTIVDSPTFDHRYSSGTTITDFASGIYPMDFDGCTRARLTNPVHLVEGNNGTAYKLVEIQGDCTDCVLNLREDDIAGGEAPATQISDSGTTSKIYWDGWETLSPTISLVFDTAGDSAFGSTTYEISAKRSGRQVIGKLFVQADVTHTTASGGFFMETTGLPAVDTGSDDSWNVGAHRQFTYGGNLFGLLENNGSNPRFKLRNSATGANGSGITTSNMPTGNTFRLAGDFNYIAQ